MKNWRNYVSNTSFHNFWKKLSEIVFWKVPKNNGRFNLILFLKKKKFLSHIGLMDKCKDASLEMMFALTIGNNIPKSLAGASVAMALLLVP